MARRRSSRGTARRLRAAPSRLALGADGRPRGLVGRSPSLWAAAPDLAWIDANRAGDRACARSPSGLALGALLPRAPRLFGLGLGAGAALRRRHRPGHQDPPRRWLGADRDLARLAEPVGYWNALALVAVFAVPGLLWLAGGGRPRWGPRSPARASPW